MDGPVDPKDFEKLAPHDIDAEQCTVSALSMGDEAVRAEILSIVRRDDFYQADHQEFFGVLVEMIEDGGKVDPVLMCAELKARDLLNKCGGSAYVGSLIHCIPSISHGPQYAQIVARHARTRKWMAVAAEIRSMAHAATRGEDTSARIREMVAGALESIEQTAGKTTEIHEVSDVLDRVCGQLEHPTDVRLIRTGIWSIDEQTGGLGVGEMTLIAARPSMGKSLLAKQIACNVALNQTPVGIVSIEESAAKVGRNIISAHARIENHLIRKNQLTAADRRKARGIATDSKGTPLYINDRATRMSDVAAVVTMMAKVKKCQVIVVDYLQLIEAEGGHNREQEVSRISRRLKTLFKQLNVAGVVVAQLNRGNEQGNVRAPRMSDLRDSGQIEQDADVILLLHRPGYYARENITDEPGHDPFPKAEDKRCFVIPAKNRDGSRQDDIILHAELEYQRFVDPKEPKDPFPARGAA